MTGRKNVRVYTLAAFLACSVVVGHRPQAEDVLPVERPAIPVDPTVGILEAFKTHSVVALGEGNHGNEQGHAFRVSLIRDSRFAAVVDDIVVEFGNSMYQDVMDRFVNGEEVPYAELSRVWQNTTQAHPVWDRPIYEAFFRAVRDVNVARPKEQRLRVLLGDAPIDWDKVRTLEDIREVGRSDSIPAGIIQREVVAKGRRALIIYGDMHYLRKNLYWNMQDKEAAEKRFSAPVDSIVANLERAGIKVFSIRTTFADLTPLQADIAGWTAPKLAVIAGTPLGLTSFRFFYPYDIQIRRPDDTWETVSSDPERSPRMQEQYDAILYLGPESSITYSQLPRELCENAEYMQMRLRRTRIAAGPNQDWAGEELRSYCAQFGEVE